MDTVVILMLIVAAWTAGFISGAIAEHQARDRDDAIEQVTRSHRHP